MTDHEYKTIFLHFVKTGGSSIERCFNSGDGYRETTYKKEGHPNRIIKEEHHTSSKKYISLNGKEIWDEYFKFSFVRNPWQYCECLLKCRVNGAGLYCRVLRQ